MLASARAPLRWVAYAAAALAATALFTLRAGRSGQLGDAAPAAFSRMIEGTADRPFVDRALLPGIARGLRALTPDAWARSIDATPGGSRLGWTTAHSTEVALALALVFACYLATAFALRRLARETYPAAPARAIDWMPAAALIVLPAWFLPNSAQLYDPATLLLAAFGLAAILEGRRLGFYAVFALACVNRETAILLAALFVLRERTRISPRRLCAHALVQAVAWAALQGATRAWHAGNPGAGQQWLFPHNLLRFVEARSALGFWPVAIAFGALAARGWRAKPRFLREGLLVCGGALLAGGLLFAVPTETRQYLDLFPLIYLLALPSVVPARQIPLGGEASRAG
jgi:hypothetical protein